MSGYQIYQNVVIWAEKYRKWKITSDKAEDERAYLSSIGQKYFMLKGKDESYNPARQVYIFIFPLNSIYIKSSNDFVRIEHLMDRKQSEPVDLFIITPDLVSSHIRKKIADEFVKAGITTLNYIYDIFKDEMPTTKAVTVPKYKIFRDKKDIAEVLDENKIVKVEQLPGIPVTDPQMIWIGAKVGDLVELIGPSESAGKKLKYRRVY